MAHTNETANYGLSQFTGTDRPSWIDDYNADMGKIDAAIYAASQSGGGMATIEHTADLTGDGTGDSPLGVADTIARTEDIPSLDGYATAESVTQAIADAIADRLTAGDIKAGSGINLKTSGNQVTISYVGDSGSSHAGAGEDSIALGNGATATGGYNISLGHNASSGTYFSIAVGDSASARYGYGIAIGASSTAAENSVAVGVAARVDAFATSSVAIGADARARESEVVSFGDDDPSSVHAHTRRLVNVTDPVNPQDVATKNYVDAHAALDRISALETKVAALEAAK